MGADRLIYIRTDGNHKIASGHLVRCFSVALCCRRLGMKVCFLVSDEESSNLLRGIWDSYCKEQNSQEDFSIVRLKTAVFDDLTRELPELLSLLGSNAVFLLDSYYVSGEYLSALKSAVKVAYLDDLRLFDYPVDLLINYDVIPKAAMPSLRLAYQNAGKLLLGASYTPLRSQFLNRQTYVRKQVSNILVATGAGDPCHFCAGFVEKMRDAVLADSSLTLHVVMGRFNPDRDALRQAAGNTPFLRLHENVSDMASLMLSCDLAVSAAGTTLYELCALGIPTVSFTMADNQLSAARAFEEAGVIPCAGDIRTAPESVIKSSADFMMHMSQNNGSQKSSYLKRKSIHENMRRLVDGNGAMRIANALRDL